MMTMSKPCLGLKLAQDQAKCHHIVAEALNGIDVTAQTDDLDLDKWMGEFFEPEKKIKRNDGEPIDMMTLSNWTLDNLNALPEEQLRMLLHELRLKNPLRDGNSKESIIDRLLEYAEKVRVSGKPSFKVETIKASYWGYFGQVQSKEVDALARTARNLEVALDKADNARATLEKTREVGVKLQEKIDRRHAEFSEALKNADGSKMARLCVEQQTDVKTFDDLQKATKDAEDIVRIGDRLRKVVRKCRCGSKTGQEVVCGQGHRCCSVCYPDGDQGCPRCGGLVGQRIVVKE
jgi:hypothetical protein